jgi:hypothetical protein
MADHQTLRRAWRRYGAYSTASADNQRRFLVLRRGILIVGILAAAAGLLSQVGSDAAATAPHASWIELQRVVRWLTFLASLLLAGMFAIAAHVDRGTLWVQCRRSAALVLREIFFYRTRCGQYTSITSDASRDELLAERLHELHRTAPEQIGLIKEADVAPRIARAPDDTPVVLGDGAPDDGLRPLTGDDYASVRVTDQRDWYSAKATRLRTLLLRYHITGIAIGLLGAVLAFAGDPWVTWVAVTTCAAAAVASWAELRRIEPNAAAYEHASGVLDDVLVWWWAIPEPERHTQDHLEKLVCACESVIESENASWTQEMQRHVADLKTEAELRAAATGKAPSAA